MSSSEKHSVIKIFDFHVGNNPQINRSNVIGYQEFQTGIFPHLPRNGFPFYLSLSRTGLLLLTQELKHLVKNYSYVCSI